MSDPQWLDGYSGQTVEELIALERKYRVDSLVLAFEQALDQKAARAGEESLTDEERIVLAIEALEGAVNNDGYEHFLDNTPEYVPIIVQSLHRIGCPKTAEITRKALTIADHMPLTSDEIKSDKRSDALNDCDRRYYEGPENIEENLFTFIKANKSKIQL